MIDYELQSLHKVRDDLDKHKRALQIAYNTAKQRALEAKITFDTVEYVTGLLQQYPGITDEETVRLQQFLEECPSFEFAMQQYTNTTAEVTKLQHTLEQVEAEYERVAAKFEQRAALIGRLTAWHGHIFDHYFHPDQEVIVRLNESHKRIHIYFCKEGYPLGAGHGHYVFHTKDGQLLAWRDPV
jgi:hypothetical protein